MSSITSIILNDVNVRNKNARLHNGDGKVGELCAIVGKSVFLDYTHEPLNTNLINSDYSKLDNSLVFTTDTNNLFYLNLDGTVTQSALTVEFASNLIRTDRLGGLFLAKSQGTNLYKIVNDAIVWQVDYSSPILNFCLASQETVVISIHANGDVVFRNGYDGSIIKVDNTTITSPEYIDSDKYGVYVTHGNSLSYWNDAFVLQQPITFPANVLGITSSNDRLFISSNEGRIFEIYLAAINKEIRIEGNPVLSKIVYNEFNGKIYAEINESGDVLEVNADLSKFNRIKYSDNEITNILPADNEKMIIQHRKGVKVLSLWSQILGYELI